MKRWLKSDYAKAMASAAAFGVFFWIVDGYFEYLFFHKNLKFLLLEGPETLIESLFTKVSIHSLFVRLSFLFAALIGGLLVSLFLYRKNQVQKSLGISEERYRRLVNTVPYGIQLTDREGKIVFSNPAHHKICGYADGELIGKYIWDLMNDHEGRDKAQDHYQLLMNKEHVPEVYFRRYVAKDGRKIDAQVNWDYIRDPDGEVEGIISVISDITMQKALESSVRQAQKMESIGNLAGGIAHDFNNLLFPILGMAELLLEDLPRGSLEYENVQQIHKAGKRGSDLVKQILAFSRQSAHIMVPTRLQNILKEVLKLSRATIPAFIEIKQDIQPDCGLVMADPTQIHQVVMNIVTNAYHAVEAERGTITVRLEERELKDLASSEGDLAPGRYAALSISDTGDGISAHLVDKIFDPYFTTKEKGKGTGLGLAVAHGIVREHKGAIKVVSEIGKGAVFHIYLPLMEKTDDADPVDEIAPQPTGTESILLVDDDESIVTIEKQMLVRLGYHVTERTSSPDALKAFTANPSAFDLVISDMDMPNITGDQLAKEIVAVRPGIPVIICTGFSERISLENAEAIGVKGFLMKPIVKGEMAKMVRKVLDEAKGPCDDG